MVNLLGSAIAVTCIYVTEIRSTLNCGFIVIDGIWSYAIFAINSITAKLMDDVGPVPVIKLIKDLGITSNIPELPSIALGSELNLKTGKLSFCTRI